ncbi:MAG: hypothetical protein OSJ24_05585 [Muribaculaceae bacterium]|nr:hypothetical protein [Muribaculaceae bacterium]
MSTPLVIWSIIAGVFALILIVRLISAFIFCAKGNHRLFEFGSEREEFFIPGDPLPSDIDNEYEEFDDL